MSSKIESLVDKLVKISGLELTDKEIIELESNKEINKLLSTIDSCKYKNKHNSLIIQNHLKSQQLNLQQNVFDSNTNAVNRASNNEDNKNNKIISNEPNTQDASDYGNISAKELQEKFDVPEFFVCCSSGLCLKELESFKFCQQANKSQISKCAKNLIKLETCVSNSINYFFEKLTSIKEI